jgi:hypothetical protein
MSRLLDDTAPDARPLDHIWEPLDSSLGEERSCMCTFVHSVVNGLFGARLYDSVLSETCSHLVALLRQASHLSISAYIVVKLELSDEDLYVVEHASYALSQVTRWREGAHAACEAGVVNHLPNLIHPQYTAVQRWSCCIIGMLAFHESTAGQILALDIGRQLVALLRQALLFSVFV